MIVTVDELKTYLRVDFDDEDDLLTDLIEASEKLCMDVARVDDEEALSEVKEAKVAAMYAAAYLYEHREEANHHGLKLMLRAILQDTRGGAF